MPMETWVKCLSPQNTLGVSGVDSDADNSNTIEVNGTTSSDVQYNRKKQHASIRLLWCVQVCVCLCEELCNCISIHVCIFRFVNVWKTLKMVLRFADAYRNLQMCFQSCHQSQLSQAFLIGSFFSFYDFFLKLEKIKDSLRSSGKKCSHTWPPFITSCSVSFHLPCE